jgi:hypothetical protein
LDWLEADSGAWSHHCKGARRLGPKPGKGHQVNLSKLIISGVNIYFIIRLRLIAAYVKYWKSIIELKYNGYDFQS